MTWGVRLSWSDAADAKFHSSSAKSMDAAMSRIMALASATRSNRGHSPYSKIPLLESEAHITDPLHSYPAADGSLFTVQPAAAGSSAQT